LKIEKMASTENTNNTIEDQFPEQNEESYDEQHLNGNGGEDSAALTLRALVSTKEAGVIIGKGKWCYRAKEGTDKGKLTRP
jgi:hypothetical protein